MTIKWIIDKTRRTTGRFRIKGRITIERRKSEFVTDFQVSSSDWDHVTQRSRQNISVNRGLAKLENKIYDIRQSIIDDDKEPTSSEIVMIITGRATSRSGINIIDYYEKYVNLIKIKQELSVSNIKHNSGTCKILKEYLRIKKQPYLQIKNIDRAFLQEFDNYLVIDYRSPLGQKIHRNTVNHHHRRLKAMLNRAIKENFILINPYNNFELKNKKTERIYLTDKELDSMREVNLEQNPSLDKVRDIFFFACNTGIRWTDSQSLIYHNIETFQKKKYLRFHMHKTHDPVAIPLTSEALLILKKYKKGKGFTKNNSLLPQISGQKFNNYIKHVAEVAGIKKKVTHHVARHTFATIGLMNGIPIDVVQKLLGHTKLETTQIYAKTLPKTLFAEMEKFKL